MKKLFWYVVGYLVETMCIFKENLIRDMKQILSGKILEYLADNMDQMLNILHVSFRMLVRIMYRLEIWHTRTARNVKALLWVCMIAVCVRAVAEWVLRDRPIRKSEQTITEVWTIPDKPQLPREERTFATTVVVSKDGKVLSDSTVMWYYKDNAWYACIFENTELRSTKAYITEKELIETLKKKYPEHPLEKAAAL